MYRVQGFAICNRQSLEAWSMEYANSHAVVVKNVMHRLQMSGICITQSARGQEYVTQSTGAKSM